MQSVNVWLTVSSLANKDPNSKSNVLFRQIELNWLNAPLNDEHDHIALYLDSEPDAPNAPAPVSVHHLSTINGKLLLQDHYLPLINFYNETLAQDELSTRQNSSPEPPGSIRRLGLDDNRWHRHRPLVASSGDAAESWSRHRRYDVEAFRPLGRHNEPSYSTDLWPTSSDEIGPVKRPGLIDECIGYCVAYHSQRKILAKSCLRTQPNWMHDARIGSRSLTTIAVAGTHNSGTYLKQRPASYKIGE